MVKGRYWVAILYPDNMIDNWEDEISQRLQVPFAYCVHDKDLEKDMKTLRKKHVHIMIAFSNTTTQNHALNVFKSLEKPGQSAIPNNVIQQVFGVRNQYDYLIHDTADSKKKKKYQYSAQERVTGNNFDIGAYEQISQADKLAMKKNLVKIIKDNGFLTYLDFLDYVCENLSDDYVEIAFNHSGTFERLTKSLYQKKHEKMIAKQYRNT